MKKICLTFLMLIATVPLWAVDFVEGGIAYKFYGNEVYVTYHASDQYGDDYYAGSVVIPSTVTRNEVTYNVTGIDPAAFAGCSKTIEVTIPESVVAIGEHAFRECTSLKKVNLPFLITELKTGTFYGCKSLESITIGANVASIGSGCFSECESLASIVCNAATPPVATGAFDSYIATLTVPYGRKGLYSADAVWGLFNNTEEGSPILNYKVTSNTTVEVISGDYGGNVVIPSEVAIDGKVYTVTSIGRDAFNRCYSIKSVIIPNSVTSIGYAAFYYCSGMTSITIGNSVTSVGDMAFKYCSNLALIEFLGVIPPSRQVETITTSNIKLKVPFESVLAYKKAGWGSLFVGYNIDGIYYLPISETEVEVVSNPSKYTGDVVIPAEIIVDEKKYSVTSIGKEVFKDCDGLTSVIIPKGVTSIGDNLFYNCSGLTSVTIPNSVTSIGRGAFDSCTGLTTVTIPNSVISIGTQAFYKCTNLTSVTIPEGVTSIGGYAFLGCTSLTYIELPSTITTIGGKAFAGGYYNNTSHFITRTMKCYAKTPPTLGDDVFDYNYLTLEVPFESVLDYKAIRGWVITSSSSTGGIAGTITYKGKDVDGIYYLATSKTEAEVVSNPSKYTGDVVIPAEIIVDDKKYSVIRIGDNAFNDCNSLTYIELPSSITSIGNRAFYDSGGVYRTIKCNAKTPPTLGSDNFFKNFLTLEVPFESVPDYRAIEGWSTVNVGSITYKGKDVDGIYYLATSKTEAEVVSNPSKYTGEVVIPTEISVDDITYKVTRIGDYAFYSCRDLTSATIPNSVTSIGKYAFYFCDGLTSVTIPNSVTSIGNKTFLECRGLTSVTFESTTPPSIEKDAFSNTSPTIKTPFASFLAYKALDELKNKTFASYDVEGIYYLPISETEAEVVSNPLNYTGDVVIPAEIIVDDKKYSVTSIGKKAFSNCTGLTSITIPNSVTGIGSEAFMNCSSLLLVDCNAVTPPTISSNSLPSSISLVLVPVGSSSAYKADEVWGLYNTKIIEKGSCDIEVTVKEGEDETLDDAIWFQTDATNAYITGLKVHGTLSQEDFELIKTNMTSLLNLDISDTDVTEIPAEIFKDKVTLMNVKLPNGLKSVGNYAFSGCKLLAGELIIPETVETIGHYAFQNCVSIEGELTIPASVKTTGRYAFQNCVQIDSLDMSNAISLETIEGGAFHSCTTLKKIKFSSVLRSINGNAFNNCKELGNFELPISLNSIGNYAFANCTSLTVLNLDGCKSLYIIDRHAFDGCTSLKELNLKGCKSLTYLYDYIFANCTSLKNIKFPTSLKTISSYAFLNCKSLAMLDFAGCESLTSINSTAFNGCTGLTVLNMVDCTSLTTINSNSFSTCSSLKTVNFPSSLTSVGAKAFANCNQLKNISVPCDIPPTIDTGADPFYGVDNIECILTYPTSLMRNYYAANYWGSFIKRDVKTNIDVEVDNLEDETEDGDTDRKPGHIWFDKDWHKHHAHHVNPIQPKSVRGIKLLAETTEPIVSTTDVSGIKGFVEDGLSMYVQNGDSVTFLIQPETGYVIESVSYGGEDVTTQIVDGVFVTPAVSGKNIKLQVSFAKETANVLLGDVNGDSEVNVTDITTLISYILGNTEGVNSAVVDINNDGEVNVTDVTTLISMILGTN